MSELAYTPYPQQLRMELVQRLHIKASTSSCKIAALLTSNEQIMRTSAPINKHLQVIEANCQAIAAHLKDIQVWALALRREQEKEEERNHEIKTK